MQQGASTWTNAWQQWLYYHFLFKLPSAFYLASNVFDERVFYRNSHPIRLTVRAFKCSRGVSHQSDPIRPSLEPLVAPVFAPPVILSSEATFVVDASCS
eukprot:6201889-Pleurochrysis_carterae.AAC.3